MVTCWILVFEIGQMSTLDEPCSGRPIEVTSPEILGKTHKIVLADHRVKASEIAETVGISAAQVCNILHERLVYDLSLIHI